MIKIYKGSSRWVFVVSSIAVKIPSFTSYRSFLWGLIANMNEVKFWNYANMKHKLCPITFYVPFGLLVVMPKVKVLTKGDGIGNDYLLSFCICENGKIPAETKLDSFGFLNNKLVCIDYG